MNRLIYNENSDLLKLEYHKSRQQYINCDLESCGCRVNTLIWISHELKAIYFETPKAACSSIKKALQIKVTNYDVKNAFIYFQSQDTSINICEKTKQILENTKKENKLFSMFEGTPDEVLELYSEYFSFMFVREPFSRVKSLWQMFCKSNLKFREQQFRTMFQRDPKDTSFEKFTELLKIYDNHHWNQYSNFSPKNKKINFIGKLESLNEDWKFISSRIGINFNLPHENKSKKFEVIATEKSIEIINKTFDDDYIKFGYKKRVL